MNGELLYKVYARTAKWTPVEGPAMEWEDLSTGQQVAWEAVGKAAAEDVLQRVTYPAVAQAIMRIIDPKST